MEADRDSRRDDRWDAFDDDEADNDNAVSDAADADAVGDPNADALVSFRDRLLPYASPSPARLP